MNFIMPDLLDPLSRKDVNTFKKDFTQLIKLAAGMDMDYRESSKDIDIYMPRYKTLIKLFNKKYPGLFLKITKTTEELKLRIFIKDEKNVKDIFINSASRIAGLKSIGAESLGAANIGSDRFNKEIDKIENNVQISYYEPDLGSTAIILEYDKKTKMVELFYNIKDATNESNPEFKLCAFYALKQGYDNKIELSVKGDEFAFNDWSEEAKKQFLDKFDPLLYE